MDADSGMEQELILDLRGSMGVETIFQSEAREIVRVLRDGWVVGILPDQDLDTVADADDKCPKQKEDLDKFQAEALMRDFPARQPGVGIDLFARRYRYGQ